MANVVNWFDIPVSNLDRARTFYSAVLDTELTPPMDLGMEGSSEDGVQAIFPAREGVGGALVQSDNYKPSQEGSVVYLNGGDDLNIPLGKVEAAGGKIVMDKMSIGENGFIAFFSDTEGNKVGLHSMG